MCGGVCCVWAGLCVLVCAGGRVEGGRPADTAAVSRRQQPALRTAPLAAHSSSPRQPSPPAPSQRPRTLRARSSLRPSIASSGPSAGAADAERASVVVLVRMLALLVTSAPAFGAGAVRRLELVEVRSSWDLEAVVLAVEGREEAAGPGAAAAGAEPVDFATNSTAALRAAPSSCCAAAPTSPAPQTWGGAGGARVRRSGRRHSRGAGGQRQA